MTSHSTGTDREKHEELLIAAFLAAVSISGEKDPRSVLLEFSVSWSQVYLDEAKRLTQSLGLHEDSLLHLLPTRSRAESILRRFVLQQEILLNPLSPSDRILAFGLTQRQWEALKNYRRTLQSDFTSPSQIRRMLATKRKQMLSSRAKTVGIAESNFARNAGAMDAIQEALIQGFIANSANARWVTSLDERVRSSHAPMHGQVRPLRIPFTTGAGNSILFPGDPTAPLPEIINCRCHVEYTL